MLGFFAHPPKRFIPERAKRKRKETRGTRECLSLDFFPGFLAAQISQNQGGNRPHWTGQENPRFLALRFCYSFPDSRDFRLSFYSLFCPEIVLPSAEAFRSIPLPLRTVRPFRTRPAGERYVSSSLRRNPSKTTSATRSTASSRATPRTSCEAFRQKASTSSSPTRPISSITGSAPAGWSRTTPRPPAPGLNLPPVKSTVFSGITASFSLILWLATNRPVHDGLEAGGFPAGQPSRLDETVFLQDWLHGRIP
jgi:hypothetical protein